MIAYLFPGQGSQKVGMGEGLFERFPERMATARRILGYSVEELCAEKGGERLNRTEYTQPALYVVNALTYFAKLQEDGVTPSMVAGHSLGEYNALLAAGVFDFETGLRLVQERGRLMAKAKNGSMAAVIGMNGAAVRQVVASQRIEDLDIANLNSPVQTVVSGTTVAVGAAQVAFEAAGARAYIKLNVSGAFHSRYMEPAQAEFESFLSSFSFAEPVIPVLANVNARVYTGERARRLLVAQVGQTIVWTTIVERMIELGVDQFAEVGPGSVLTKFVEQIRNATPAPVAATQPRGVPLQSVASASQKVAGVVRPSGRPNTAPVASRGRDRVFDVLSEAIRHVLPDVDPARIEPEGRLRDLGANSVDRAEILTVAMQKLRLRIPLVELAGARDIGMLAEILRQSTPA